MKKTPLKRRTPIKRRAPKPKRPLRAKRVTVDPFETQYQLVLVPVRYGNYKA